MTKKLMEMKSNKKKGFTLIELIVVIAILGILAAIAVPTFNGLRTDAAQKVADANARTVYTAAMSYYAMENMDPAALSGNELGDLLGTGFEGSYSVSVTSGSVTATYISKDGITGTYPTK